MSNYVSDRYIEVLNMDKYKCKVCGYIYNPEEGDKRTKIEPETSFEDLPDLWRCPKCGAGKLKFIKI